MPGDNFSLLKFINSTVMHMLASGYLIIELQKSLNTGYSYVLM